MSWHTGRATRMVPAKAAALDHYRKDRDMNNYETVRHASYRASEAKKEERSMWAIKLPIYNEGYDNGYAQAIKDADIPSPTMDDKTEHEAVLEAMWAFILNDPDCTSLDCAKAFYKGWMACKGTKE